MPRRVRTRSALLWALTRMREGANPLSMIAEAARHGIDIASLLAVAPGCVSTSRRQEVP